MRRRKGERGSDELMSKHVFERVLALMRAERERQRLFSEREDRLAAEAGGRHAGEPDNEG